MKKLISILFVLILGSSSLLSQTTTGHVRVNWFPGDCEACCLGMQYGPCITVVRVFDDYVIVDDSCVVVSNTDHYDFSFTMPQCTSNWNIIVYAAVWAGCDGGPLCCNGKNSGVTFTCSQIENGVSVDVPWVP